MRYVLCVFFLVAAWLPAMPANAQDLRLDVGLIGGHFEQQVKTEVGGERGEKIVVDTELGVQTFGTYRVWGPLSAGLFAQLDVGERSSGRFAGFDAQNRTQIDRQTGGTYTEFWIGPMLRGQWRTLFVEVGYGAFGVRDDEARDDLADETGDTDPALRTSPTIAWMLNLGAGVPITEHLQGVLRLEYRVRYYDRRGDQDLADDIVHGTQNLTPFVGLAWMPAL